MLTREYYEFEKMKANRQKQIEKSLIPIKKANNDANNNNSVNYGLILSTLGRQGSPKIMENLMKKLDEHNKKHFIVLMSEIFPDKLKLFGNQIDA